MDGIVMIVLLLFLLFVLKGFAKRKCLKKVKCSPRENKRVGGKTFQIADRAFRSGTKIIKDGGD
jgi:hypothetical protein